MAVRRTRSSKQTLSINATFQGADMRTVERLARAWRCSGVEVVRRLVSSETTRQDGAATPESERAEAAP